MNITATHSSLHHPSATPVKVAQSPPSTLTVSSTTDAIEGVSVNRISSSSVNPTYNKPVPINQLSDNPQPSLSDSASQDNTLAPNVANKEEEGSSTKSESDEKNNVDPQTNSEGYSEAELESINALEVRHREVIAHEKAHSAVGGQHAGTPRYSYETGPDGERYAVSGEVSIDTSIISGDPQATLQKAQQIKAAALAPVDPSIQDLRVANKADQMANQARSDIIEANSGDQERNQASSTRNEVSVQEHFTDQDNVSATDMGDSKKEQLMSERNVHINNHYQNSTAVNPTSSFQTQA